MGASIVYEALVFSVVFLCGIGGWWASRKRANASDLRAPLLLTEEASSADARVESALRIAREGSNECPKCTFENLAQRAFCAICGAVFNPGSIQNRASLVTKCQRRVRRRKEWVRTVAEDRSIGWQTTMNELSYITPWVVRMRAPKDTQPTKKPQVSIREGIGAEPGAQVVITIDNDTEDTKVSDADVLATVAGRLNVLATLLTVATENATAADAAVSSLSFNDVDEAQALVEQRSQEMRDGVMQSQLDFPTKLAQFITASSTLFLNATIRDDGTTRSSRLVIDRTTLPGDSIAAIASLTPIEACAALRIDFVGDQGIDAGGVYREWFLLFNEQIVKPEAGVFVCVDPEEQTFYLNPHSHAILGDSHLAHFYAVGRVFGRALLEGNVTGFHLAHPLLKIILGLPVTLQDFEYFDPEAYKNLKWLLEHDNVDALGLDYTVVEQLPDGTTRTVEIVPGGSERDVTDANKHEFVERKIKYILVDSVAPQLFAFLKGLYEIVPAEMLVLFDVEELDFILSGSDTIDVDDWERHTKCTSDLIDHPAYKHFWQLVREMTPEERRLLLQFATGSSRVPPAGFAALSSFDGRLCPFTLYGVGAWQDKGYVRSHACFNRLDLPRLKTKKGMEQALSAALLSENTGFTMH